MAEQRINLNNFKSSGVYTIEIDQSENIALPLTTGRLIVGSSKVGPYNTVVLINDLRTLRAVFGEIDSKLEKAGSFFHRTIEVALREGPVFALNVIPLDSDEDVVLNLDKAYFTTFNTESASSNDTEVPTNYPIVQFFNRRKLWVAESDQLNKSKNLALGDDYITSPGTLGQVTIEANKILSFANLGKTNVTIWVRKANIQGYDVTTKEWYSTIVGNLNELPTFVHPDDLISDYFVEVIAVNGDWSNYLKLSKDPIYSQFFNEEGLISANSANFFALREIRVVNRTIGCLIPEFKDQRGSTVAIDRLINRTFPTTGILCALDASKLDLIDLTEDTFNDQDVYSHRLDIIGHGYDNLTYSTDDGGYDDDGVTLVDPVIQIDTLSYRRPADVSLIFKIKSNPTVNSTLNESSFLAGYQDNGNTTDVAEGDSYVIEPTGDDYLVATKGSKLYDAYFNGFVKDGDEVTDGANTYYINIEDGLSVTTGISAVSISYIKIKVFADVTQLNQVDIQNGDGFYQATDTLDYLKITLDGGDDYKHVFDLANDFTSWSVTQPNVLTLELLTLPGNKALVDEFIKVGQYILAKTTAGRPRLLKILSISSQVGLSPATTTYTVTLSSPSTDEVLGIDLTGGLLQVYKGIHNFVKSIKGQYLEGFKIRANSLPNGTATRQKEILEYLFTDTKIPQALSNGELIDFRYVVDSYEGEISGSSKYYLSKLAALHGQAMAILNSPSIQQFEKSVDPSFISSSNKLVSTQLISEGGDLSLNPSFTFKFAEEDINGIPLSSYANYYFPNLIILDGNKNISVPPAAYISNLYVQKFKNGTPFLIVAGSKRGVISDVDVVGLEYDLTDEDRDFLEPVGHNLIVKRRGYGTLLLSNNTGYQRINSALNNSHVRDNLSTIERDIERILFNFLFDFNDEITRLRVKSLVENYLDNVVLARGLSSYEIIFDSSNNSEEVISANAAIIDIRVDFPRGIQKFINRITITRVGGSLSSESTGFIPSF
jgi:hypothetical protein